MEKNTKIILAAFLIIVILLFFMFLATRNKTGQGNSDVSTGFFEPLGSGEIEIIEFSDFKCPVCKAQSPILKQVLEEYGEDVKLYYRNFPLPMHENSFDAALASMCASEQEKFWQYHDILFENQDKLNKENLKNYAIQVNLNEEQFNECLEEEKYKKDIEKDFDDGRKAGVKGTPTFFINKEKVEGYKNFQFFEQLIEEIKSKRR